MLSALNATCLRERDKLAILRRNVQIVRHKLAIGRKTVITFIFYSVAETTTKELPNANSELQESLNY